MLGGKGIAVQCDETAICNGRIISDTSHTNDEKPNIQWILGLIKETNKKNVL
ncbi:hypothetical protein H311_01176 [Anncaliia algerae PRA109]|nr:hypothetical protein H311_01176 [Anncaliia algerae PRA109]